MHVVLYFFSTVPLLAFAFLIYLAFGATAAGLDPIQLFNLAGMAFLSFAVFYSGGAVADAINGMKKKLADADTRAKELEP